MKRVIADARIRQRDPISAGSQFPRCRERTHDYLPDSRCRREATHIGGDMGGEDVGVAVCPACACYYADARPMTLDEAEALLRAIERGDLEP
jgi:hypothetical protein